MSGSVNKVILVGHLGRDPEVQTTQAGGKFARLSLATSERWKDRATGERREATEWHRIVIFNENLVDVAERFLRRGSQIYVEGQLTTRKWRDKDGQDRWTTEITLGRFRGELTMLDGKDDAQGGQGARAQTAARSAPEDLDDDIPF